MQLVIVSLQSCLEEQFFLPFFPLPSCRPPAGETRGVKAAADHRALGGGERGFARKQSMGSFFLPEWAESESTWLCHLIGAPSPDPIRHACKMSNCLAVIGPSGRFTAPLQGRSCDNATN